MIKALSYLGVFCVVLNGMAIDAWAEKNDLCPKIGYKHIKKVKRDGSKFQVNGKTYILTEGYKNLPNWANPITKKRFSPSVVSVLAPKSVIEVCTYEYQTLVGRAYRFSVGRVAPKGILSAIKSLGGKAQDSYKTLKKKWRKASLRAHPDRGGSVEKQQKLNNAMDDVTSFLSP